MQDRIGGHRALRVCGAGVAALAHLGTHDWLTLGCRNTVAARLLSLPGPVGSSSLSSSWMKLGSKEGWDLLWTISLIRVGSGEAGVTAAS